MFDVPDYESSIRHKYTKLSYTKWGQFMDGFTYKDGWKFEITEPGWLTITASNSDSNGTDQIQDYCWWNMCEWPGEEKAFALIHDAILRIEIHEMYEFWRHEGKQVIDPHPPIDGSDLLASTDEPQLGMFRIA